MVACDCIIILLLNAGAVKPGGEDGIPAWRTNSWHARHARVLSD